MKCTLETKIIDSVGAAGAIAHALILHKKGKHSTSLEEAARITGKKLDATRVLLHRLSEAGWADEGREDRDRRTLVFWMRKSQKIK